MSDVWSAPDGVPPGDYQVPAEFGGYQGPPPDPANDPLVPPPDSAFTGWTDRVVGTLRRSGLRLLLIMAITVGLPEIAFAMAFTAIDTLVVDAFAAFVVTIVLLLLTAFFSAVGWGAGISAVTADAAGRPLTLGKALGEGLRRGVTMFEWYVGYGLLCALGLVLLVLPGVYVAVAGSLFGVVVMYERGVSPIRRSFSLVHGAFGRVAGRVLLLLLIYLGIGLVVSVLFSAVGVSVGGPLGLGNLTSDAVTGLQLVGDIVSAALDVPLTAVLLAGLLVTYAETRSLREQVSTGQLWAAISA